MQKDPSLMPSAIVKIQPNGVKLRGFGPWSTYKFCLSCILPTISVAKFQLSRILQQPARFKRSKLFRDIALWGVQLKKCSLIPSAWADNHDKREQFNAGSLQKLCKAFNWNSLNFRIRPSSMLQEERTLESRISQLILTLFSRGLVFPDRLSTLDRRPRPKSPSRASLRSRFPMRTSFMLQEERPLESRVSRLILTLSSRGFVFPDRADTLDRRPGPKSLRRAGRSCRFWICVSSAAGGAHWFLCTPWHRLALFVRGFVSMHEKFVFDTMQGKLDRFLEN